MTRAANSLFCRAARGEKVERTPVWAMRQAGRWDPEFRKLRAGLDFYSFSQNAELSAQASLCPLRFGVDAIILFYDITTLSVAMGQEFTLVADAGPKPTVPITSHSNLAGLSGTPDEGKLRPVFRTLELVCQAIPETVPALVFAGAPFTLATYMIGTGKNLELTRKFIAERPEVWRYLLDLIASATVGFVRELLARGASAFQLFDSWAGSLTPAEYSEFAQAYHERIFNEVEGTSILFVKDSPYWDAMARSGAKIVSLGKECDLADVKVKYPSLVVQGNVDHELLIDGTAEQVRLATQKCLDAGGGSRHILNLDHGMDKDAKVDNFRVFVESALDR